MFSKCYKILPTGINCRSGRETERENRRDNSFERKSMMERVERKEMQWNQKDGAMAVENDKKQENETKI